MCIYDVFFDGIPWRLRSRAKQVGVSSRHRPTEAGVNGFTGVAGVGCGPPFPGGTRAVR